VRAWVRNAPRPTAIDLFSGAGGLSLGLRDAGFSVLLGADWDLRAVETHEANLGGLGYTGDLSDPSDLLDHLEGWGINEVDLVAGGVPCQPFSRAGRSMIRNLVATGVRSAEDPRADLWQGFMMVVRRLKPRAVLVENVPDLPSWDDGSVLMGFYESLRELGYAVDARVLDAFQYGVPQHRARLILIGLRDTGSFDWPKPSHKITTLRDAIGDLPPVPPAQRAERISYFGARSVFQKRMRRGVDKHDRDAVHDHITRDIRDDDAEAFGLLGEGQTYADLPQHLRRYRSDIFTDKYKRLAWSEVSRSITAHIAKDGYWYIHPQQNRTLSIREAARVQTFPDWFRFAGSPSHRLRQIGNAVPPLLAESVARKLGAALTQNGEKTSGSSFDFRARLLDGQGRSRRRYPWRTGRADPWKVLMGELCLARTRSDLVPPTFATLCRIAPSPAALTAHREPVEALKPVRIGARAETLVDVARALVQRHGGSVPDADLELRSLPGIGENVAQAVLCFGFGRRVVLLDATTARVVQRFCGRTDTRRWQLRLDLYQLAGTRGPDAEFNRALLDHGATICQVDEPQCDGCPVRGRCAFHAGVAPLPDLGTPVEARVDAA
ncbi:MAG TPA: DNA (cytosine-5-)-methyltransferase, partial [Gemmatimonadaceae bacterium]|nr:DNA (cytosine-5-)-methyltransferase [Gemmatimonadaceae bacterium]